MSSSLQRFAATIREINQRYSRPHIEMSRGVRISLLALRIYLLLLVAVIVYKFILILG